MNGELFRALPARSRLLRAGVLGTAVLLSACGDGGSPTAPPSEPKIKIARVETNFLACTDPCGVDLTYETRRLDTNEVVAVPLKITGDGFHVNQVQTQLPDGRVSFMWEYPRPKTGQITYRLKVCPAAGTCDILTATVGVP